ncbi:MAG: AAA family ATPase [Actinobacteria bacterium]|nr:AAA family ATPase [Actinomycetota bacterium]
MSKANIKEVKRVFPEVAVKDLRRESDPSIFKFSSTDEVEPLEGTIGQDRAIESIEFGFGIKTKGFNLYAAGPPGVGKTSTIKSYVQVKAKREPVPDDWCYVNNFSDPDRPLAVSLPPGRGRILAKDMDELVNSARAEIPRAFESKEYEERKTRIANEFEAQREKGLAEIEKKAEERGFAVDITTAGIITIPLMKGRPLRREEYSLLPEEQRREIQEAGEELQSEINEVLTRIRRLDKEAKEKVQDLDKEIALFAIGHLLQDLRDRYGDFPKVLSYLDQVEKDIIENLDDFRVGEKPRVSIPGLEALQRPPTFDRYKVNVIVNNSDLEGAPVVFELNPSYYNLVGKTEYRAQFGAMTTDFSMIKAGALHRANGGFIMVNILDVLLNPLAWDVLKRAIRSEEIRIELMGEQFRAIPAATIKPEPIPLDIKVVLIGNPRIYMLLYHLDEDFRELFKIKADFNIEMDRTSEHEEKYASFISNRTREAKLRPFDPSGVARIVEYGSWLAGDQKKLSTRFLDIADMVSEASYWAEATDSSPVVSAEHVDKAIDHKKFRSNMIEAKVQELINRGIVMIQTDEAVVGQINALSIISLGDYYFGRPSKITAKIHLGKRGVVNIEREIDQSGPSHSKGVLILANYLAGMYATDKPLSISASITFEQSYEGVDGDSASSTELYTLLSALSDVPIKQSLAVTGSVNQRGEIQPIGGVSRKIEGFYDICNARGLTGDQGVLIPIQNVDNLMLKKEVTDAVKAGKFRIYPVKTIDEGIEILTGVEAGERRADGTYPEGTINYLVNERLKQMADILKEYEYSEEEREAA